MRPLILAAILACATLPAAAADLTVFAAASLKTALDRIGADWEAQSGDRVRISYAGSSQLAKQIEAGAPADLFLSASPEWMDYLEDAGRIDAAARVDLLGNRLVLVAPAGAASGGEIGAGFDLAGLLGDGKLAMALYDSVPAGVYGKQALTALGLWDAVRPQVAQADNVRAALALVATGEAKAGIVYATDAAAEPKVTVIGTFPEDSHDPITYPAAPVTGSAEDARPFLAYLSEAKARAVFEDEGFTVLGD